jgi:hypothetical protein
MVFMVRLRQNEFLPGYDFELVDSEMLSILKRREVNRRKWPGQRSDLKGRPVWRNGNGIEKDIFRNQG